VKCQCYKTFKIFIVRASVADEHSFTFSRVQDIRSSGWQHIYVSPPWWCLRSCPRCVPLLQTAYWNPEEYFRVSDFIYSSVSFITTIQKKQLIFIQSIYEGKYNSYTFPISIDSVMFLLLYFIEIFLRLEYLNYCMFLDTSFSIIFCFIYCCYSIICFVTCYTIYCYCIMFVFIYIIWNIDFN
jgi:hypothetical protein